MELLSCCRTGAPNRRTVWTELTHISFPGFRRTIPLPNVFQRLGKGLLSHCAIDMPGVASENELVVIALCSKHSGHIFVGENPIMHAVAHDIWIEQIAVANFHPDSDRLGRGVRYEVLVKFPCAMWRLRIVRPLLVHECPGVGENTMVKLRMIPSHTQGA